METECICGFWFLGIWENFQFLKFEIIAFSAKIYVCLKTSLDSLQFAPKKTSVKFSPIVDGDWVTSGCTFREISITKSRKSFF